MISGTFGLKNFLEIYMERATVIWYTQAIILTISVIAIVILAILSMGMGSSIFGGAGTGGDYSGTIRILTTPDLHSHLFGMSDTDTGTRIGRIGALANTLSEETDGTLYLFAGDLGEGGFYHRYGGIPEGTAVSMAGVDAAVTGNHAFDFSTEFFKEMATNTPYPLLCANLDFADPELNDTVKDYIILDAGGAVVGVFGIITPQLEKIVILSDDIILYENTAEIGNAAVKALKEEGADIIIALTHQEKYDDITLAESVPGIDLIIGGHDHAVWNETITFDDDRQTLIVHAGRYGEEMGAVDITMVDGAVTQTSVQHYTITEDMPDDEAITAYITPYYRMYTESLSESIGNSSVPLDVQIKTLRTGETNAGNYITDAVCRNVPDVDIAFISAGSIRGDCIIPSGEISYLTLHDMFPYENRIVTIQMTGYEVKETLERSASAYVVAGDGCPGAQRVRSGGFLQVSGVQFVLNTKGNSFCMDYDTGTVISTGERIEDLMVVTDSGGVEPIGMDTTYTVAMTDYIAGGGDGYIYVAEMPDDKKFDTAMNLMEIVADDIGRNSPISPVVYGRITIA